MNIEPIKKMKRKKKAAIYFFSPFGPSLDSICFLFCNWIFHWHHSSFILNFFFFYLNIYSYTYTTSILCDCQSVFNSTFVALIIVTCTGDINLKYIILLLPVQILTPSPWSITKWDSWLLEQLQQLTYLYHYTKI